MIATTRSKIDITGITEEGQRFKTTTNIVFLPDNHIEVETADRINPSRITFETKQEKITLEKKDGSWVESKGKEIDYRFFEGKKKKEEVGESTALQLDKN